MSAWSRITETKVKFIFFPITLFYWGVIFWRNVFYNFRFFVSRKVPSKIISVGNLTAGGTGKTPAVIYLAKLLASTHKVAIISRGYGRKTAGTQVVTDGTTIPNDWRNFGDEPTQLALNLNGIPIVVDNNRHRGAMYVIENFNPDIIILDDAFQHRAIERDLDLVLINSQASSADYKLIPHGLLREPLSHIKRADALIFTKSNLAQAPEKILKMAKSTNLPVFNSTLKNSGFVSKDLKPYTVLDNTPAIAVSAIADPDSFYKSLDLANVNVVRKLAYYDHYEFSRSDLDTFKNTLKEHSGSIIITTEKDLVRLRNLKLSGIEICALSIQFVLNKDGEKYILEKIS